MMTTTTAVSPHEDSTDFALFSCCSFRDIKARKSRRVKTGTENQPRIERRKEKIARAYMTLNTDSVEFQVNSSHSSVTNVVLNRGPNIDTNRQNL